MESKFTMEIHQIPQADILDILFEGRNKAYGAYDLRKTYNRRLAKALAFTGSFCILMAGSYVLAGRLQKPHPIVRELDTGLILTEVIPKDKLIVTPPPTTQKSQQIATIKDVTIRIVPDNQVTPEVAPPPNDKLENMKIGNVNRQGDPDNGRPTPSPGDFAGKGIIATLPQQDSQDSIFTKVEIESGYIGGPEAWRRFLLKTFRYPENAVEQGVQGTVIVQFIVDQEGNISDAQAISGPDELREEALRTIKKSGKWTPAIQNGRKVKSYRRQPIVCMLPAE
jgi:periplasmic protein TonB